MQGPCSHRLCSLIVVGLALLACGSARAQDVSGMLDQVKQALGLGDGKDASSGAAASANAPNPAPQTLYRYVNRQGRVVYTNIEEQVPLEQRARGKLDLSRIELNTEIGTELDRRLQEQHAALSQSSYCKQLRSAASEGFWSQLWNDFAPLLICGGLLLGFLLYTPRALRRFGAPVWAKTLMMAIPSLAIAGAVTFSMTHTNKTILELKRQVEPCAEETFARLKTEPQALLKHAQLVEHLKRQVGKLGGGALPGELGRPEL
jgi:hypothetical protein